MARHVPVPSKSSGILIDQDGSLLIGCCSAAPASIAHSAQSRWEIHSRRALSEKGGTCSLSRGRLRPKARRAASDAGLLPGQPLGCLMRAKPSELLSGLDSRLETEPMACSVGAGASAPSAQRQEPQAEPHPLPASACRAQWKLQTAPDPKCDHDLLTHWLRPQVPHANLC